jgi:hypothetical protein
MTPQSHPANPHYAAMMAAVDSYSVPRYESTFDLRDRKPFVRTQVTPWYKARDVKGGL